MGLMETQGNAEETDREILLEIRAKLQEIVSTFEDYKPLLQRYRQASEAGSFLAARRAMKGTKTQ